jgi:phosphoribosylglycinamide formyltransferase-1
VVILISGRGSNMHALIEGSRRPHPPYAVAQVLSDRADAAGLPLAASLGVAGRALREPPGGGRSAFERVLAQAIDELDPSVIALAGFMRILSGAFVERYAGRILNIHPSLLPKYPGLHTHRRALAAGDPVHGATVHFVTQELDGGPPIIQAQVAVGAGDDETALAARVLAMEHQIYPLAVGWLCAGRLRLDGGRAWLDGAPLAAPVHYQDGHAAGA